MVADGQQLDRRQCIGHGIEHEVVAVQILAKGIGDRCRHGGKQADCLDGLGRVIEVAPTDAREAGQIGDDRAAQLIEQIVEGRTCIGFDQKGFDGFEARQEAVGPLSEV